MTPTPLDGVGVIITASSPTKGCLDLLEQLATFLSQHKVPSVLLIECSLAADAATANAQLRPACTSPTIHLSLTQPLNAHAALSAAISLLNLPPSHLAVIKVDDQTSTSAAPSAMRSSSPNNETLHLHPENSSVEQLFLLSLLHMASVMKNTSCSLVCIGYSMKKSRQKALTVQNMLPFLPVDGAFFLPVDLDFISTLSQAESEESNIIGTVAEQVIDVFLHKATDFFEKELTPTSEENFQQAATVTTTALGSVPQYRPELHFIVEKLQRAGCCIVDPLENLEIVVDRIKMAHALDAACIAARKLALPVRIPAWHLVEHRFSPEILRTASMVSKVSLPCVVKPQVACGVDEAHQMAFILHPSGLFSELEVPLPALLQEYVDHKSIVWKVYVAGNHVFSVQKRSTPDLQPLRDFLASSHVSVGVGNVGGSGEDDDLDIPTSIEFNSLESLPVSLPWLSRLIGTGPSTANAAAQPPPAGVMHSGFLTQLANVFRKHLGLTLFGFDVIFDHAAGEAVVLDLNFFPSFRGIPEAPAALRTAVLEKYKIHRRNRKRNGENNKI